MKERMYEGVNDGLQRMCDLQVLVRVGGRVECDAQPPRHVQRIHPVLRAMPVQVLCHRSEPPAPPTCATRHGKVPR